MIVLFLKAAIPGGAAADLFPSQVDVHGYTTKRGVYVAPHRGVRHKRHDVPAQADLFAAPAPKPKAAKPADDRQTDLFSVQAPVEPVAAPAPAPKPKAEEVEPEKTTEAPAATEPEKPAEPSTAPAAVVPEPPIAWGVPAGATKKERKAFNKRALDILAAKPDDQMTAEDRQALARYTGRGGIGDSLNEFYTDPAVASAMWTMLANAGFQGGEVLEPSSGTGVFLHTAPAGTRVTAVELDRTSARIAVILHRPAGHEVNNASLERFATQDGRQFDAVIGNVPFGLRGATIKDDKPELAKADQYFVDTALDKTKDGGLVALIVPTGIMDSSSGRSVRERLLTKGEFLGALRLPNTAFEASHTGVTSDIVLFRKRPADAAGALSTLDQDQLQAVGVWDAEFLAGSYFTGGRGAANVMGRMEEGWRAKAGMGHDITVTGTMQGVPEAIASWQPPAPTEPVTVENVLDVIGDDPAARKRALSAALKPAYQVAKLGDVKVVNGVRYVLQGDPPRWHRADSEVPEAVRGAVAIAEMLDDLQEGRARDPRFTRAALTEALDEYVKEHGVPARNRDMLRWLAAPAMPMEEGGDEAAHRELVGNLHRRVARLLGAVSDDGSYSDLVTGRDRTGAAGVATLDTVATKLALEVGTFTAEQLAAAWGKGTAQDVLDHLFASPDYAVEADGTTWTTLDSYLSGELWPKLDAARAAAAHGGLDPAFKVKYEQQAAALERTIQPQSLEDVEVLLSSGFIKPEILTAWFKARKEDWHKEHPTAQWEGPTAWTVTIEDGMYEIRNAKKGSAEGHYGDDKIIWQYLNRYRLKKDDLPTVERLNQEFKDWLLASEYRDQVEDTYNRTYRGFRQKDYSDQPIAIPGLNPALDVNAYHFAGLRWALEAGKGIIAADVGLGKTGRGLMLAKLAKVTGQAKKPTFVVPKSVLANWVKEAAFWFPGSRVLVIGETYSTDKDGNVTSKPDDEATRRRKYHEMQQNDFDFVFISQPAWNDLDVDPITKGQYANSDFWAQRGEKLGNAGDKRLNEIRTRYEQALADREFSKREGTVYFGDLGIDMVLLDEGHAYKNLYAVKARFGETPKFLGGGGLSNRAQDTYFKTRQLREMNGDKGVFMLTATPTKNSPLEVYSMLSHIAPEAFERMGIKNSEDFLDRFCVFENDTILNLDGEIEDALVTAGFKNLGELREVMRRYIDRKTAADVGLVIPSADRREHMIDMTPKQQAVYAELRERAAESESDATGDAHIFSIMSAMGKASIDLSLLGHAGERSPKIDACVEQAMKGAEEGGQVIFCDHNDVHDKIVAELVAKGVSRKRIAIINAKVASSSAQRQKISDDFNAGKLDYVIGNTATMGEGINLQKRTTDIHHLDLPWEPASVQQRNGRGQRQGNKNASIRIHSYLAKGSFDGYRWQTVGAKKDWQDLLWNGGDQVENLARASVGRQDMLIMLSADPEAARAKLESDKTAAAERKTAEERGKSISDFVRLQQMERNIKRLKANGRTAGESAARVEAKAEVLRDSLRGNKYFPHKHLLEGSEPFLIEPKTGHAWTVGAGFESTGAKDSPLPGNGQPSKWVVTGVDIDTGKLTCRRWGTSFPFSVDVEIGRMKSGAVPFAHDQAAEDAAIAEDRKTVATVALGRGDGGPKKPADLKGLPPDIIEQNAEAYQKRFKEAARSYAVTHDSGVPMLGPDGDAELVRSYDVRRKIDTHDFMLPTETNREKAIAGYAAHAEGRTISSNLVHGRRGSIKANGIKTEYAGNFGSHGNPWEGPMRNLWGNHVHDQARAEVMRRAVERVAAADDFRTAMVGAVPALDIPTYGGSLTRHAWPKAIIAALYDKAKALGVLDRPLSEVAKPGGKYKSDLHSGILNTTLDYNYVSDHPHGSVGRFLDALASKQREPAKELENA